MTVAYTYSNLIVKSIVILLHTEEFGNLFSPWNADDPQRPLLDSADASAQLIIARYIKIVKPITYSQQKVNY